MTLEELDSWTETWEEKLYKRDYDSLPSFMEEALWEYFEDGGSAKEYNDTYFFNKEVSNMINDLYQEYTKEINENI